MGCWNSTCGVTQLPILAGERVVVILLSHEPERINLVDGICNSSDLCDPMFLPIRAEYNDYGGIQNVDDDFNSRLILDWANNALAGKDAEYPLLLDEEELKMKAIRAKELVKMGKDPNEFGFGESSKSRHNKVKEFKTIEDVFEAIERGRVTYGHPYNIPTFPERSRPAITYIMIREDVFNGLLVATNDEKNAHRKSMGDYYAKAYANKTNKENYVKASIAERDLDWWQQIQQDTELVLENMARQSKVRLAGEKVWRDDFGGRGLKSSIGFGEHNKVSGHLMGAHGFSMRVLAKEIEIRFDNGTIVKDNESWKQLAKSMADYVVFNTAFNMLRKTYMPQAGAGSQNDEFNLHAKLGIIVGHVAAEHARRRAEQDD